MGFSANRAGRRAVPIREGVGQHLRNARDDRKERGAIGANEETLDDLVAVALEATQVKIAPALRAGRTDLLRDLRTKLAPYALPAKLSIRDDFPRTATDKIDRRQLRMEAMGLGEEST